jgi:hypothetical protein
MNEKLNLYECEELIKIVETRAEMNDGELSEEDLADLVKAQTQSLDKLGKLASYVKYLNGFSQLASEEEARLRERRRIAENRVAGIKRYLLPYLETHGPVSIGVHSLSTRRSQGVVLADGFNNPLYGETISEFKPNKKVIKDSLKAGIEIRGAVLENRTNVQIK